MKIFNIFLKKKRTNADVFLKSHQEGWQSKKPRHHAEVIL